MSDSCAIVSDSCALVLNSECCKQMMAAVSHNVNSKTIGLSPGSALNLNLQRRVIALATTSTVTSTIQRSAQRVLQAGWTLLLPTQEERVKTLLSLLPAAGNGFLTIGIY